MNNGRAGMKCPLCSKQFDKFVEEYKMRQHLVETDFRNHLLTHRKDELVICVVLYHGFRDWTKPALWDSIDPIEKEILDRRILEKL